MTPDVLRALRKQHGLTQQQLAALMGTTQTTVKRWELGMHPINEGWARLAFETLELRARLHETLARPRAPATVYERFIIQ